MEVRFVEPGFVVMDWSGEEPGDWCGGVARAARTCYMSKPKGLDSDVALARSLVRNGHHAMLEFGWLWVEFVTSIGVSRELIRHRHFSFAEQSTRYVNYGRRGFEFVMPDVPERQRSAVRLACERAAETYSEMLATGATPEQARAVLPLCTATRIQVAGDVREWRHMLSLRTARDAHPEMRALMTPVLEYLKDRDPVLFGDVGGE